MRHYVALAIDLGWVALSAILAVVIRDNFVPYESHLEAALAYTAIAVVVSAIVFAIVGPHKTLWAYTSLHTVRR